MTAKLPSKLTYESLHAVESEGIVRALASLAYVRSQGRALPEGSNDKFIEFITVTVWPKLASIRSQVEFDRQHHQWVTSLRQRLLKTNGDESSYGQGQKSLNVWLKFYVDWASLPDHETAGRLRPWLHCPIDSVVADSLKERYPVEYKQRIRPRLAHIPYYDQRQHHSLSWMDEALYLEWQMWVRELCPQKPVLVDLAWVFER